MYFCSVYNFSAVNYNFSPFKIHKMPMIFGRAQQTSKFFSKLDQSFLK